MTNTNDGNTERKKIVESFSFSQEAFRESGVYSYESAVGDLNRVQKDGKLSKYSFVITAENKKDINELLQIVKEGKALPDPGRSYCKPYVGPSYDELKKQVDGYNENIKRAEDQRDGYSAKVIEFEKEAQDWKEKYSMLVAKCVVRQNEINKIVRIIDDLDTKMWPFVNIRRVIDVIRPILNKLL